MCVKNTESWAHPSKTDSLSLADQESAFVTSIPGDPDESCSGHTWRHLASLNQEPTFGPGRLGLPHEVDSPC